MGTLGPRDWTGTIVKVHHSTVGNRTEYLFHVDERFHADEEDFYVSEYEIEQCERPKP
jgi:hypothetical protein